MKKNTVKTLREIRRENLIILVRQFGSQRNICVLAKTSEAYLSQILKLRDRNIGDALARKLEKGCKKPEGWMDINHVTEKIIIPQDKREAELLVIYSKLNPQMRTALLEVARSIQKAKGK